MGSWSHGLGARRGLLPCPPHHPVPTAFHHGACFTCGLTAWPPASQPGVAGGWAGARGRGRLCWGAGGAGLILTQDPPLGLSGGLPPPTAARLWAGLRHRETAVGFALLVAGPGALGAGVRAEPRLQVRPVVTPGPAGEEAEKRQAVWPPAAALGCLPQRPKLSLSRPPEGTAPAGVGGTAQREEGGVGSSARGPPAFPGPAVCTPGRGRQLTLSHCADKRPVLLSVRAGPTLGKHRC